MSARDLRRVYRVPGRLCIGPTDLSTAFPHGGTELGAVGRVVVYASQPVLEIPAEEYGVEPQDALFLGDRLVLAAALKQPWDDTALSTIFRNVSTGAVTGEKGLDFPGATSSPGAKLSAQSVVVLFSPLDPITHKAVILHKALPYSDGEFVLSFTDELRLEVEFLAIRDAGGRLGSMKPLADMVL